jgi:hypothetical protein
MEYLSSVFEMNVVAVHGRGALALSPLTATAEAS